MKIYKVLERRKENKGADKSCKYVIIMTNFAGKIYKKSRKYYKIRGGVAKYRKLC
jgi:hypothetical protein